MTDHGWGADDDLELAILGAQVSLDLEGQLKESVYLELLVFE